MCDSSVPSIVPPVQTLSNFQREDPVTSGIAVIIAFAASIAATIFVITLSSCWQTYRWYRMKRHRVLIDQITQPMFNAPSEYKGSEYK
jgi:hypothetical protein